MSYLIIEEDHTLSYTDDFDLCLRIRCDNGEVSVVDIGDCKPKGKNINRNDDGIEERWSYIAYYEGDRECI